MLVEIAETTRLGRFPVDKRFLEFTNHVDEESSSQTFLRLLSAFTLRPFNTEHSVWHRVVKHPTLVEIEDVFGVV